MATESTVQILGLKELHDTLQSLPAQIEEKIMRQAMRTGLNVLADAAKGKLSSDGNVKSGALQQSVRVSFKGIKISEQKYGTLRGYVMAGNNKAWYAHLIEFGTGSFYVGKGTKSKRAPYEIYSKTGKSLFFGGIFADKVTHPGIHPQPFMRPSFDAYGEKAINAFADYVRNRLPKEIKKAGL